MASDARGVDWWVGRVAVSQRFSGDLPEIREWPFADQLQAHLLLDAIEDIQALHRPEPA